MKRLLFGLFLLVATLGGASMHAQHPSDYNEVKARTHEAVFSFPGMDREIVYRFSTSFYSPEPVSQEFRVLIRPDGSVRYVKPILQPGIDAEFRLGGAHALYKFCFAAVEEETGEVWVDVKMTVGEK